MVYRYKNGWYCVHCVWLGKRYDLVQNLKWFPKCLEVYWENPWIKVYYMGVFKNTFNCVLKYHSWKDVDRLVENVLEFMGMLKKLGETEIRMVVNSSYKEGTIGEKEHLHALVSIGNRTGIFKGEGNEGKRVEKKPLEREPYDTDNRIELSVGDEKDIYGVLRREGEKLGIGVREEHNWYQTRSFYLFLDYDRYYDRYCEKGEKGEKGGHIGWLSTEGEGV